MTTDAARSYALDAYCPFVRFNSSASSSAFSSLAEAKALASRGEMVSKHAADLLESPKQPWPSADKRDPATDLAATLRKVEAIAHSVQATTALIGARNALQFSGEVDPTKFNDLLHRFVTEF